MSSKIIVRRLGGESLDLNTDGATSVRDARVRAADAIGVSATLLELLIGDHTLRDEDPFADLFGSEITSIILPPQPEIAFLGGGETTTRGMS